jgi:V8-like Glu-specific endopeptidase
MGHGMGRVARQRDARVNVLIYAGILNLVCVLVTGDAHAFSAADVYRRAASSVVLIFGFEDGGVGSSGSGSLLSREGLILTNDHVISKGDEGRRFSNLVVYFKPNRISGDNARDLIQPYPVEVIARDPQLDLALLRVLDPPVGLRPMEIGNSEEVEIGEDVAAIGHPAGGGLWTLTTGTISSRRREGARDIFQTDAAINPGNSGGPLLDEHARLVGINTFVRRLNEQGLPLEGLNYSLRSRLALDWLNRQAGNRFVAVSLIAGESAETTDASSGDGQPESSVRSTASEREAMRPYAAGESSPARSRPPSPQIERSDPRPRQFTAPDGTSMYGVPNLENDLDASLRQVRAEWADLTRRREAAIDEMDRLFDDDSDL